MFSCFDGLTTLETFLTSSPWPARTCRPLGLLQGLPTPSSSLTSRPWMTWVLPATSHSWVQRGLSLGKHGVASLLRWTGAWELKRREGILAQGQEQLKVGEEAHSCGPGSLPRARRALSARPSKEKEASPSHSQLWHPDSELPGHGLTHGGHCQAQGLTLYQHAAQKVFSSCCRGREKPQTCFTVAM